jgi:hypothetical protein
MKNGAAAIPAVRQEGSSRDEVNEQWTALPVAYQAASSGDAMGCNDVGGLSCAVAVLERLPSSCGVRGRYGTHAVRMGSAAQRRREGKAFPADGC